MEGDIVAFGLLNELCVVSGLFACQISHERIRDANVLNKHAERISCFLLAMHRVYGSESAIGEDLGTLVSP